MSAPYDAEKQPIYSDGSDQYKNYRGPTSERSAGDCLFLFAFLMFWASVVIVGAFAVKSGDPYKLGKAIDYKGNACGVLNYKGDDPSYDMRFRPYLYYINSTNLTSGVCISSCPRMADDLMCTYPYQTQPSADKLKVLGSECFYQYRSRQVLNRCLPTNPSKAGTIDNYLSSNVWDQLIADTMLSWDYVTFAFALALLLGLIWLIMLRWMTFQVILVTMVGSIITTAALAYYIYDDGSKRMHLMHQLFQHRRNMARRDIYIAYITYSLGLVSLVWAAALTMMVVLKSRSITVASGLIKMSSRCLSDLLSLFVWPLVMSFLILGTLTFWGNVSAYLATVQDPTLRSALIYFFFALLWACGFLLATSYMIISGTVASWYFVRDKKGLSHVMWKAFWRTIGLHLGSTALGCLILPPVSVYRFMINLVKVKITRESNPCVRCVYGCWNCCLNCFELCLKYVSKGAYVQIAMHGDSFLVAGQRAFSLYARNMPRLQTVQAHGNFYLFLCKYFITSTTALVGWVWMMNDFKDQIASPLFPVLILCVGTYSVASLFIGVVDAAIETVLQCYCEDMERSKNGPDTFATADMRGILGGNESSPTFGGGYGGYSNYGT